MQTECGTAPNARGRVRGPAAALAIASLALALPAAGLGARNTSANGVSPGSGPAVLTPGHGHPFAPVLGDWEGTVNGSPVSFEVGVAPGARPRFTLDHLVALHPTTCPIASSSYSELIVTSARPTLVPISGSLDSFGFTGRFSGRRTALLSSRYRVGRCSGRLRWTLHPARRAVVQDGVWHISYSDGETGRMRIVAGGRVLTALRIPQALERCSGTTGSIDLFIGAAGRAGLDAPHVRVSVRFSRRSASGRLNGGGAGCAGGPVRFTARPA